MDRWAIVGFSVACLVFSVSARGGETAPPARTYAGFHMTQAERDALRQRVNTEQWADE